MNQQTAQSLVKLIDKIEVLTAACLLTIGHQTVAEVISACEEAKLAIKRDETIV